MELLDLCFLPLDAFEHLLPLLVGEFYPRQILRARDRRRCDLGALGHLGPEHARQEGAAHAHGRAEREELPAIVTM